jgi:hypothetical protein
VSELAGDDAVVQVGRRGRHDPGRADHVQEPSRAPLPQKDPDLPTNSTKMHWTVVLIGCPGRITLRTFQHPSDTDPSDGSSDVTPPPFQGPRGLVKRFVSDQMG